MIDKNPGYVSFQSLLKIVLGCSVRFSQKKFQISSNYKVSYSYLQVDATNICSACFEEVMTHYTFREKVLKNLKLSTEESHPVQAGVKIFLNKINEPTSVVIHQDVLSIVPKSLKNRFDSKILVQETLDPSVSLERCDNIEELKQKLKDEVAAQKRDLVVEAPEGIFGGDDYYVSLRVLNECPTSSTVTVPEPLSMGTRKKSPIYGSYREESSDNETSQGLFNDEVLDTPGPSSNEYPNCSTMSYKRKASSIQNSAKRARVSRVVSKSAMSINLCVLVDVNVV